VLAEQHDQWSETRYYLNIPKDAGTEALPQPEALQTSE
jgi:hypothetical protein